MFHVIATGRLAQDPTIRETNSKTKVASFSIASDRRFSGDGGEKKTDFVDCVAFGKTAEVIEKFFGKGRPITVVGDLVIDSYVPKGEDKPRTKPQINIDRVEFALSDGTKQPASAAPAETSVPETAQGDSDSSGYDPWNLPSE